MRNAIAADFPLPRIMGIRAAFSVAFGIAAIVAPHATLDALAILWGIYAFGDGIVATFAGAVTRSFWLATFGVAMLVAGVCAFLRPEVSGVNLLCVIGLWSLMRAAFDVSCLTTVVRNATIKWLLVANGLVSACFGLLLMNAAEETAASYLLSSYALISGAILFVSSRNRSVLEELHP